MTRTTFILLLSSFWALSVAGEEQPSHSLMNDSDALTLDPQIRNWVLLPMVLIVLLVQFMRMYLIQYMGSDTKANVTEVQQKCVAVVVDETEKDFWDSHLLSFI